MEQVAIYCRLSTEDDRSSSDESQSIQNQKLLLREYCRERDWNIYDIYCDDGYSGTDKNRPAFNRMLRDCEMRKISIVLCKDQSRFSRDSMIVEQYINDKFLEWNVRFVGVVDNADTNSSSYNMTRLFSGVVNEMYVMDISGKIRHTLKAKREQGQFTGSFAPYGYLIDPQDKHRLIIDEVTAPNVQKVFEMYTQGYGYRKIVKHMNEQNIPSPTKYKEMSGSNFNCINAQSSPCYGLWTQSTIFTMLRNEAYTGTLVQGKSHNINYKNKKRKKVAPQDWIRVPNSHEPIIDEATWSQAQQRIKSRVRSTRITETVSPLSGKVKCAICGKPMKRNVYYNKKRTIQYYSLQCSTYKVGAMNCENVRSISGVTLEKYILEELNKLIEAYCNSDQIQLTDMLQQQITDSQRSLAELQKQKKISEDRLTALYMDKLDKVIGLTEYQTFSAKFQSELETVTIKIEEVTAQIEKQKTLRLTEGEKLNFIKKKSKIANLTKPIVDEFIESVSIGMSKPDGTRDISITWTI